MTAIFVKSITTQPRILFAGNALGKVLGNSSFLSAGIVNGDWAIEPRTETIFGELTYGF